MPRFHTELKAPAAGGWLELVIAAALGLAALGGAFAVYRNEQHNHRASELFSAAVRDFDNAGQLYASGNAVLSRDQSVFLEYAKATEASDRRLATFIFTNLMGSTLQSAVSWLQGHANMRSAHPVRTPFSGDPYYNVPQFAFAKRSTETSDADFAEAKRQQERADHFTLVEVVLATALFLYGIAGVASTPRLRRGTLAIGLVIFALAVALLIAT